MRLSQKRVAPKRRRKRGEGKEEEEKRRRKRGEGKEEKPDSGLR
jgi:hypothetical protein